MARGETQTAGFSFGPCRFEKTALIKLSANLLPAATPSSSTRPSIVLCPLVEKPGSAVEAPPCSLLKDKSHFAECGRYPYVGDGKCPNLSPLPQGCLSSCLQQTLLCPFSVGHMIEAPKMIAKGLQKLPTKDISVAMGPRTLISFAGKSQSFEAMDEKCSKQC